MAVQGEDGKTYYDESEVAQAIQQQQGNTGMMDQAEGEEHLNARQFYLETDDFLTGLFEFLTGRTKGGIERNESAASMPDEAANYIVNHLRFSVDKIGRLTTLEQKDIRRLTFEARESFGAWLVLEGFLKHGMDANNNKSLMTQVESLIYMALMWSKNGGGKTFLSTTSRSVETQSYNLGASQQQYPSVDPPKKRNKGTMGWW